jgi:hypothetical protein
MPAIFAVAASEGAPWRAGPPDVERAEVFAAAVVVARAGDFRDAFLETAMELSCGDRKIWDAAASARTPGTAETAPPQARPAAAGRSP